jgi:ribulose-5-phosphate 4-epimerase/fuculose-1-phosphate aldolase
MKELTHAKADLTAFNIHSRIHKDKKKTVVFLQHHGVVVCGENMACAFDDLYYLERVCTVQVLAQSAGDWGMD